MKLQNAVWWMCLLSIPIDLCCLFVNVAFHNKTLMVYCAFLAVAKLFTCALLARRK